MINMIILQGRLTRNPEIRYTNETKIPVASYTLAVDRGYKNNGKSVADFIPCIAWDKRAEFARDYLHKGMMIAVEGTLQSRRWQDNQGNNRIAFEVIVSSHHFCESKRTERPPHPADCIASSNSDDFTEIPDDGEVPF